MQVIISIIVTLLVLTAVSYTHLDVYKRQQEILSLPCTESPFFDVLEQHYYCNLNELQKLIGTEKGNLLFLSVNL